MFTILADALFTATLNERGSNLPEHPKYHADRHLPREAPNGRKLRHGQDPYRDLW